jgi:hypothetical protein
VFFDKTSIDDDEKLTADKVKEYIKYLREHPAEKKVKSLIYYTLNP